MNTCHAQMRTTGIPSRHRPWLLLCCLLLLCGWPTYAPASPQPTEPARATAAEPPAREAPTTELTATTATNSLGLAIAKSLGALALIIGLLLLLAAGAKKLGLGGQPAGSAGLITVLDTRMIAPKKYIAVIDIAGQALAVGITEHQITLLTSIEDSAALQDHGTADKKPGKQLSSRFATILGRAVHKGVLKN